MPSLSFASPPPLGGRPKNGRFVVSAHGGLYEIRNTTTGDFYVGSATWLARRLRQHKSLLIAEAHPNRWLQASYTKYGPAAFEFRVLLVLERHDVLSAEQRLLDRVFGTSGCMNAAAQVEKSRAGVKQSPAAIAKMRAANLGRRASESTRAAQREGQRFRAPMTGQYKGVSFDSSRQKFFAQLTHNKQRVLMQRFNTAEDAALAYNAAARGLWGNECFLNDIIEAKSL